MSSKAKATSKSNVRPNIPLELLLMFGVAILISALFATGLIDSSSVTISGNGLTNTIVISSNTNLTIQGSNNNISIIILNNAMVNLRISGGSSNRVFAENGMVNLTIKGGGTNNVTFDNVSMGNLAISGGSNNQITCTVMCRHPPSYSISVSGGSNQILNITNNTALTLNINGGSNSQLSLQGGSISVCSIKGGSNNKIIARGVGNTGACPAGAVTTVSTPETLEYVGYFLPGCSPSSATPSPGFGINAESKGSVVDVAADPPAGCNIFAWIKTNYTDPNAIGPNLNNDLNSFIAPNESPSQVLPCFAFEPYATFFGDSVNGWCPNTLSVNMTRNYTIAAVYAPTTTSFTWAKTSNSMCAASPSPAFGTYTENTLAVVRGFGNGYSGTGNITTFYANPGPGCVVTYNTTATAADPFSGGVSCSGYACQISLQYGQYPGRLNIMQENGTNGFYGKGILVFVSGVSVDYQPGVPQNTSTTTTLSTTTTVPPTTTVFPPNVPVPVVNTINVGDQGPFDVAFSPSGTFAYVTGSLGNVIIINVAQNATVGLITVGSAPSGVAFSPSGTFAYVANAGSNTVSVINTTTNTVVNTIDIGSPAMGVAVNPSGTLAYVVSHYYIVNGNYVISNVSVINTATNRVVNTINTGQVIGSLFSQSVPVAFSPSGAFAYIAEGRGNNVIVINVAQNATAGLIPVGSGPSGVAFNPSGSIAYVANSGSNSVSVISTATNASTNTVGPLDSNALAIPWGIAVSPSGPQSYTTLFNCGAVSVINTTTNILVDSVILSPGTLPSSVAFNPSGSLAYVTNFSPSGNSTISVISTNNVNTDISLGFATPPPPASSCISK